MGYFRYLSLYLASCLVLFLTACSEQPELPKTDKPKTSSPSAQVAQKPQLPPATARQQTPPAKAPGGTDTQPKPYFKSSFQQVTSKLDPNGEFYVYWSFERGMEEFKKTCGDIADVLAKGDKDEDKQTKTRERLDSFAKTMTETGIFDFSAIGASSVSTGKETFRNRLVLHRYPDKSRGQLWQALGDKPHSFDGLNYLPDNTIAFGFVDLDLNFLLDWSLSKAAPKGKKGTVQKVIKKNEKKVATVKHFLSKCTGEWGLAFLRIPPKDMDNKEALDTVEWVLFAKSDTKELLSSVLKELELKAAPSKDNPAVLDISLTQDDDTEKKPYKLAATQDNSYIIVSTSAATISELLKTAKGNGKPLTDTKEFQRVTRNIPPTGNMIQYVSPQVQKMIATYTKNLLPKLSNKHLGDLASEEDKKVQTDIADKLLGDETFYYCVMENNPDGLVFTANATDRLGIIPAFQVLAIMGAGAGLGAYTGMESLSSLDHLDIEIDMFDLHLGLMNYSFDNAGKLPPSGIPGLGKLWAGKYIAEDDRDPSVFIADSDDRTPPDKMTKKSFTEDNCSYFYFGDGKPLKDFEKAKMPLMVTKRGVLDGVAVLYANGDVEFSEDDIDSAKALYKYLTKDHDYKPAAKAFLKEQAKKWADL